MGRTETEILRELADVKQKIIDNQKLIIDNKQKIIDTQKKIIEVQRATLMRYIEAFRQFKTTLGINDETEEEG